MHTGVSGSSALLHLLARTHYNTRAACTRVPGNTDSFAYCSCKLNGLICCCLGRQKWVTQTEFSYSTSPQFSSAGPRNPLNDCESSLNRLHPSRRGRRQQDNYSLGQLSFSVRGGYVAVAEPKIQCSWRDSQFWLTLIGESVLCHLKGRSHSAIVKVPVQL